MASEVTLQTEADRDLRSYEYRGYLSSSTQWSIPDLVLYSIRGGRQVSVVRLSNTIPNIPGGTKDQGPVRADHGLSRGWLVQGPFETKQTAYVEPTRGLECKIGPVSSKRAVNFESVGRISQVVRTSSIPHFTRPGD